MITLFKAIPFIVVCTLLTTMLVMNVNLVNAQEANNSLPSSKIQLEQALIEQKGKVVYVDFWASWCAPCRKSFPWMNKVQEKYKAQGFNVVSINLDAKRALAEKFLSETPANFTVIYDPKGSVAKHFKIQGMPSSMLIGRDGEIKSRHTGFFINKTPAYQQEIEQLLSINVGE